MVNKKWNFSIELNSWHFFIFSFIVPFVLLYGTFSYFNNSYAISETELYDILEISTENLNQKENRNYTFNSETYNYTGQSNWGLSFDRFLEILSDLEYVTISYVNYGSQNSPNYMLLVDCFEYSNFPINLTNNSTISAVYYRFTYSYNNNNLYVSGTNVSSGNVEIYHGNMDLGHNFDFSYNGVLYPANISFAPVNTISLTAMHSGNKFTFTLSNQLQVQLVGYDITDFTFAVYRYYSDNNHWLEFTGQNDFFQYIGENDAAGIFHIYWGNINYFPSGTYKYSATYIGNNENIDTFTVFSDTFEITENVIDNSATGSVDSNGNIDININNGNSVDNVKDFLGSPADFNNAKITDNDLEKSLNMSETVNPYENFLMTFINGLTASLTGTAPETWSFKVHSWGQTFTLRYQDFIPNYNQDMINFLTTIWTVVGVIYISKWVTKIVESINVGDVSTTLELIEEKYSNLL